jgi:putative Mg2+ transporter-C (MgtC) family protein
MFFVSAPVAFVPMTTLEFVAHIAVAMVCGLVLGVERQWRQHPVGMRTSALICMGAALFVSVSALVAKDDGPTRITSQVVAGIGFLGGGAIVREGFNIKGLTTAATIWCSAAVGALCGFGFLLHAAIGTGLILFVNFGLHPLSEWLDRTLEKFSDDPFMYRLTIACSAKRVNQVRLLVMQHLSSSTKLSLRSVAKEAADDGQHVILSAECQATDPAEAVLEELIAMVHLEEGVTAVRWERLGAGPSSKRMTVA